MFDFHYHENVFNAVECNKINNKRDAALDKDKLFQTLCDSAGEVECEFTSIFLIDCHSSRPIQVPARLDSCTHLDCCDLSTWITVCIGFRSARLETLNFKCPICNKIGFFENVKIDFFLLQQIKQNHFKLRLNAKDRSVAPLLPNEKTQQETTTYVDSETDDDEIKKEPKEFYSDPEEEELVMFGYPNDIQNQPQTNYTRKARKVMWWLNAFVGPNFISRNVSKSGEQPLETTWCFDFMMSLQQKSTANKFTIWKRSGTKNPVDALNRQMTERPELRPLKGWLCLENSRVVGFVAEQIAKLAKVDITVVANMLNDIIPVVKNKRTLLPNTADETPESSGVRRQR